MGTRTRIIEGTWRCTSCDTQGILGRHKKCPTCGNPREETGGESDFDFGAVDPATGKSLREGVQDASARELAGAGEDWFCPYCQASNRGDAPRCRGCNAERPEDPAERRRARAPSPPPQPEPVATAPPKKRRAGCLPVLLLLLAGFGVYRWWGGQTHEVRGEVADLTWTRTVRRETFRPVQRQDWEDALRRQAPRMPVQGAGEVAGVANVRDCVRRQRGTRRVADGTERVCSTRSRKVACGSEERCTRRDKGNGFAEETCQDVTKYCSESYEDCRDRTRYREEPVYGRQCTYDTFAWAPSDTRTLSGHADAPRWPELAAGPLDRLRREEGYQVSVRYEGKKGPHTHLLEPHGEAEFGRWRMGDRVRLTVTNLGEVTKVDRAP
ncbi:hydrogenase maturation nickel metallochaperone HypA [Aggregicoccus sp. 17bor-14]|uniref:hypothetical protein n=1 Tax=Myxococcaceae TaxID=31 RepID=UPI00129D0ED3|nr:MULTISPECIES: hypothetical protein [Myxococcaceae]MBF5042294.1 hypothetical protein [Simulacricoccus sp. 17bor-14]MRI88068.1 hydrogenase maturation nickel metallochaperone HypA [Aggregicoccus sp. 17bor-14]